VSDKILPVIALLAFLSAPIVIGGAETSKESPKEVQKSDSHSPEGKTQDSKVEAKADAKSSEKGASTAPEVEPKRKLSNECLASEEVIADLEAREKKIKEQEGALKEREKEIAAQEAALKQELAKLEAKRSEIRGVSDKEVAQREEQVNKLIETFEGMSPKAAAQVLGGVDDSLAVLALGRLTSLKAGKILANLKSEKSARLSEMMAYGKAVKGKEGTRGDTHERTPANAEE
jgi:flagellar motility protein MotE (MotC chaperone)